MNEQIDFYSVPGTSECECDNISAVVLFFLSFYFLQVCCSKASVIYARHPVIVFQCVRLTEAAPGYLSATFYDFYPVKFS